MKSATANSDHNKECLAEARRSHREAQDGIARLLGLVEKGLMDAEDPALRERLVALKLQRDESGKEAAEIQKRITSGAPTITSAKIIQVAELLRDKLYNGPPEFRQAYARLIMEEVSVTDEEIFISGSTEVLAQAASEGMGVPTTAVLSFVQEWRTREDSNLWPLPSEQFNLPFDQLRWASLQCAILL